MLTFCWANDFTYDQTIMMCQSIIANEERRLSTETVSDWFSYLREIAVVALDNLYKSTA